jgi:hypothetical protein
MHTAMQTVMKNVMQSVSAGRLLWWYDEGAFGNS